MRLTKQFVIAAQRACCIHRILQDFLYTESIDIAKKRMINDEGMAGDFADDSLINEVVDYCTMIILVAKTSKKYRTILVSQVFSGIDAEKKLPIKCTLARFNKQGYSTKSF